jgi:hypothetical protein
MERLLAGGSSLFRGGGGPPNGRSLDSWAANAGPTIDPNQNIAAHPAIRRFERMDAIRHQTIPFPAV